MSARDQRRTQTVLRWWHAADSERRCRAVQKLTRLAFIQDDSRAEQRLESIVRMVTGRPV